MTKQEFALITATIRTFYSKENIIPNQQAMELWYQQLADLEYKTVELFINKWVATEKWSPSIADIRSGCAEILLGEVEDWSSSFEKVRRAISSYGYMRYDEAIETFDELTRMAVDRMGWRNLCLSEEEQATKRSQYRDIYNSIAAQSKKERQLPENIRQLILTSSKGVELLNG